MRARSAAFTAFVLILWQASIGLCADSAGPRGPEQGPDRRQAWLIPDSGTGLMMHGLVYRPAGAGPFPLVVINHGSEQSAELRAKMKLDVYEAAAHWFVQHGYAVALPQRPGHGQTPGPYLEDQKTCADADYRGAGIGAARRIAAAVSYFSTQPFVKAGGVIVAGQSAGGWGALALAGGNSHNVKAVIAFAPGRGGHVNGRANSNCAPEKLIATAGEFGATAHIPVLALYAENDSYFPPDLSQRIGDAYKNAGGRMEFHLLPDLEGEGHFLLEMPGAFAVWGKTVEDFLAKLK